MKIRPMLKKLKPHEANLYEAVARYVEHGKGKLLIIGGIEVQEWPGEPLGKFRVAISCLGRKPKFAAPKKPLLAARAKGGEE